MLYKKELSGIPLLPVPKCKDRYATYIVAAERFLLPQSGEVLVVDYHERKDNYALVARFFSDGDNWLTVREWPAKAWTKQTPIDGYYGASSDKTWSTPESAEAAAFLAVNAEYRYYPQRAKKSAAYYVEAFVDEHRRDEKDRAVAAREHKQLQLFAMFPQLPADLTDWLADAVWPTYMFISKAVKGVRSGRCGFCDGVHELPGSIRHKHEGICPSCGRPVVYIGDWYFRQTLTDKATACVNHKVDGALLIRWTKVTRTFEHPDYRPVYRTEDVGYNLHLHERGKEKLYCFLKKPMPYMSGLYWTRRRMGEPVTIPAYVYPRNLAEVFGRRFYNVDLEHAMSGIAREVQWHSVLQRLERYPASEYLLKLQLPQLVTALGSRPCEKPGFASVLGVDSNLKPLFLKYSPTAHEYHVLKAWGKPVSEADFLALRRLGVFDLDYARHALLKMSFTKFVNYFGRQKGGKRDVSPIIRNWLDYIDMANAVGVDLSRKSLKFPIDAKAAHDAILPDFLLVKHAAEEAEWDSKIGTVYANLPFLRHADGAYLAVLPAHRSDLIAEGKSLGHCVGGKSYAQKHMSGENLIVFIRRASAEMTPFVTMELRMEDFHICQLFGAGNSDPKKDVRKFAEQFVKNLKAAMTAGKERAA